MSNESQKKKMNELTDLHIALQRLYTRNVFFSSVSMCIKKVATESVPTAGVKWDKRARELVMLVNPTYFAALNEDEQLGLIIHELYHVIYGHVHGEMPSNTKAWNISCDLAINSLIHAHHKSDCKLPNEAWLPGVKFNRDSGASKEVMDFCERLKPCLAASAYYESVKEFLEDGDDGMQSMDEHGGWSHDELAGSSVRETLERAADIADREGVKGWGSIPASTVAEIRSLIEAHVDWKSLFRQWIGFTIPHDRRKSVKKINKKYPYIHSGRLRNRKGKILFAIDQSGSVSNRALEAVWSALAASNRSTEFWTVNFDSDVDAGSLKRWTKNCQFDVKRTKRGGTDFQAVVDWLSTCTEHFDGLCMVTDGECSKPTTASIRRCWLLVPGSKLYFDTDEFVAHIEINR